ncbi:MAG: hypothetical protein M3P91_02470 [Actinomycetota bacterium]|nr:hypothetical protein [Actinomycetota bacterium]
MDVGAWCGHCSESFRLVELLQDGNAGSCPRCGYRFAPSYAAVEAGAVRRVIEAAAALEAAGRLLRDTAPELHLDRQKLFTDLERALGGAPDHGGPQ